MEIEIQPTADIDIDIIFRLYDDAIAYQKQVGNNQWLGFSKEAVLKEIEEQRHFKIVLAGEIVATFCITLSDPLIWKTAGENEAIYIHRIATSQSARGQNLLQHIIDWAKEFAKRNDLMFIRMDTGSGNDRLINYYSKCGFTFLGDTTVDYTSDLPAHYKDGKFALLEMKL
jgi:GNAT superfamily N-acetyltransferase